MDDQKKTQHLSVFLVKEGITSTKEILNVDHCGPPIEVAISGYGKGQLYVRKSPAKPPKWTALFEGLLNPKTLAVPGVSGAFLIKVEDRRFVLAFGQGGRFLIRDNVSEERFGLLCALNSVDPKTFRCVDVQSLDAIESHTRIQSGQETTSDQFGLDVEQDMLKAIVGAPKDSLLGTRMTGTDSLSVSVKVDLANLPPLLNAYRKNFERDLSASDHAWVNNIALTKDPALVAALELDLQNKLSAKQFEDMWLSIPEIIDWHTVKGFMYTGGRKVIFPDINFQAFLGTLKDDEEVTLELLQKRNVYCADADHNKVSKHWPIYKCLYAELEHDGRKYILNDGKWFSVDNDFVERTNAEFAKIPYAPITLPIFAGGEEGEYNEKVASADPTKYVLLDDKKKVMHGGGHGQVEICDLLTRTKDLIHIKRYGKSSVLSHLFAQGFVSGQLIQIDAEFRKKVRKQLNPPFRELFDVSTKPKQDEFTIVFGVISDASGKKLHLPFFSRVNLNNTYKVLKGFGYKVQLLKIDVDETYAKTQTIPKKKL